VTRCPRCNGPLDRSETLIPGRTVLRCRHCRTFAAPVEGHEPEWIEAGPDVVARLRRIAEEQERIVQLVNSPSDDPRWGTP
jgi:hypothetical protein